MSPPTARKSSRLKALSQSSVRSPLIAGLLMLLFSSLCSREPIAYGLQIPSGLLASIFLGAPAGIEDHVVRIFTDPLLTVNAACSGIRFFAFIAGLGGGYWCGKRLWRWMALLPLCYLIALLGNAARIAMAWQFRRFTEGRIPEWLQEYVHMGIGMVCFLTLVAALLYWINRQPSTVKEPLHETIR
jgi:exosortase/archaeosortase family protein